MITFSPCPTAEEIIDILEPMSMKERRKTVAIIENQFSMDSALALFDEGNQEAASERVRPLESEVEAHKPAIFLTLLAWADLNCFKDTKNEIIEVLRDLRLRVGTAVSYSLPRENGFVVKESNLRIICRVEADRVLVMGIANVKFDPLGKVWRYFTQPKALDLIRTSELYFRRADLLSADPFECRLPRKVIETRKHAIEGVYPANGDDFLGSFEVPRQSTYLCCWTIREQESYLAWKHYCTDVVREGSPEGGFAMQTTQRRLYHLHSQLRASHDVHLRRVGYLDPWEDDLPSHAVGEEVFWKAKRFSDEREMRFAILSPYGWSSSPDFVHPMLPDFRRVHFDIACAVESIIINPFASQSDRGKLLKCLQDYQPALVERIRQSILLAEPPLESRS